ncbi:hypothetical protein [Aquisphaera insulae]|uniref:hypothetical protein n=1 Tax=Aquisphaera insulae TaxID=2712864 RepID=UPI0013ED8753|nr:hypothetical protein [Aquisphaera insulae]
MVPKFHVLAAVGVLLHSGCSGSLSPTEVLQGLYGAPPPPAVKIVHFYGDRFGMDPSFAWVLSPVDDTYLKTLIKTKGLKTPAPGEKPTMVRYGFPSWWDHDRIEALSELYFDDNEGLRRIWVDRDGGRLYVEFIGT